MKKTGKERFKNMSYEELDKEIDKIEANWMKALMFRAIKEIRPEYVYNCDKKEERK